MLGTILPFEINLGGLLQLGCCITFSVIVGGLLFLEGDTYLAGSVSCINDDVLYIPRHFTMVINACPQHLGFFSSFSVL